MEIRRKYTERNRVIVHVMWPSYGFTHEFNDDVEADAYIMGLKDSAMATFNFWKETLGET